MFLPFIAQDMHLNLTAVGLLGTIMTSFGFFLALPGSYLATKVGGIRVLVASVFFYGMGYYY